MIFLLLEHGTGGNRLFKRHGRKKRTGTSMGGNRILLMRSNTSWLLLLSLDTLIFSIPLLKMFNLCFPVIFFPYTDLILRSPIFRWWQSLWPLILGLLHLNLQLLFLTEMRFRLVELSKREHLFMWMENLKYLGCETASVLLSNKTTLVASWCLLPELLVIVPFAEYAAWHSWALPLDKAMWGWMHC